MQIPREKVWRASELYLSLVLIHFLPGPPHPSPSPIYIKPTGSHVGVSSYSHSVVKAPAHRRDVFEMPARYLFSLLLYVHVHAIGGTREIIAVPGSALTSVYFTLRLCCFVYLSDISDITGPEMYQGTPGIFFHISSCRGSPFIFWVKLSVQDKGG